MITSQWGFVCPCVCEEEILSLLSVCFHQQHLASKDWLVPVLRPSQITNTASFVSSSDILKGGGGESTPKMGAFLILIDMIPEFLFDQLPDGGE